jgi:hypothetical protein
MVNPYHWLPEADEVDKRDKKSLAEQQKNLLKTEVHCIDQLINKPLIYLLFHALNLIVKRKSASH